MPLNELKIESKIRACKGASALPSGGGIRVTISRRISSTPIPVLALASIMSSVCIHQINNLILNLFRHCTGHVHFIENRNYFKIMFDCHVKVRYCLC